MTLLIYAVFPCKTLEDDITYLGFYKIGSGLIKALCQRLFHSLINICQRDISHVFCLSAFWIHGAASLIAENKGSTAEGFRLKVESSEGENGTTSRTLITHRISHIIPSGPSLVWLLLSVLIFASILILMLR